MGLIDYEYSDVNQKNYYLKNTTTNLFYLGFSKEKINKPLWGDKKEAKVIEEMEALHTQRRLANLYSPAQKILLVEA